MKRSPMMLPISAIRFEVGVIATKKKPVKKNSGLWRRHASPANAAQARITAPAMKTWTSSHPTAPQPNNGIAL